MKTGVCIVCCGDIRFGFVRKLSPAADGLFDAILLGGATAHCPDAYQLGHPLLPYGAWSITLAK